MKVSDLNGKALNWAIAKCEGYEGEPVWLSRQSSASTDWEQAGPIIERERITIDDFLFAIEIAISNQKTE